MIKTHLEILAADSRASWSAIEQAYADVRMVWDPKRFVTDERLRKRAEEKQREVELAWRKLRSARLAIEKYGSSFDPELPLLDQYELCRRELEEKSGKVNGRKATKAKPSATPIEDLVRSSTTMWNSQAEPSPTRTKKSVPSGKSKRRKKRPKIERRRRQSRNKVLDLAMGTATFVALVLAAGVCAAIYSKPGPSAMVQAPSVVEEFEPLPAAQLEVVEPVVPMASLRSADFEQMMSARQATESPLIEAAKVCDIPKISERLAYGEGLLVADSSGLSPLMWAARSNCVEGIREMLSRGADRNAASSNGFTALDWARWYNNYESVSLLQ